MNGKVEPNWLIDKEFLQRFVARDVTLWAKNYAEVEEVAHRLDWLDAVNTGDKIIQLAEKLLDDLVSEGFTDAVVLGMGGSSLAPEVFSMIFQDPELKQKEKLQLSILDTTDPIQIGDKRKDLPISKTIFIVSSKSGGTAEVNALEAYFWEELLRLGIEKPGSHFIAITDPGTILEKKGIEKGYRKVILANPNVGGRYSALIEFGLVPAVLMGIDCTKLLRQAQKMEINSGDIQSAINNPGVNLGGFLAEAYFAGRDKLTIITDPDLESLGSWVEQLIAESSGKDGKGILPIVHEPLQSSNFYSEDRVFVFFSKDDRHNSFVDELGVHGHPVLIIKSDDPYDLGAEFLRWETAAAVACALIGVNAFDQPNVQLSKSISQQMIAEIKKNSGLKEQEPIFSSDEVSVFSEDEGLENCQTLADLINNFLKQTKQGDFVGINAFVSRDAEYFSGLQILRDDIASTTNLATTLGFGPRFLHSTGQIHKGGINNGHFLIITVEHDNDIDIPGEGMSFGTLQIAQAIGDIRALQQMNRHVVRLHFKKGKLNHVILAGLVS